MRDLFDIEENAIYKPLADKLRPTTLEEFVGQEDIVGKDSPLYQMINSDNISSMIFWGPPGVGKTTLAKIIAKKTDSIFKELSAVTSGVKDIKAIIDEAEFNKANGKKTILFVDEIHRFNKAQQDAFLPYVESGMIILIGATTENPSFEVNSALLSRCKVYVLNTLTKENIINIIKRAIKLENENNKVQIIIDEDSLDILANLSNGDARSALNTLESILNITKISKNKKVINKKGLESFLKSKMFIYDKKGEEHYNLISALHKSMRNSDPDAAIYYLARMLEAGEDPLYVARRLIRFASEDIGLANPQALTIATSAYEAAHYIGMPECTVNLSEAVVYLSVSPKSNALYIAYESAKKDAKRTANVGVPLNLRNAETKLMSDIGYGKGYEYSQNYEQKITDMQCLPDELVGTKYYHPSNFGKEKAIAEELKRIEQIKKDIHNQKK